MSLDIHDTSNKAYIVLGSPGTATSFIAKALHDQGVDMGDIRKIKGKEYYEDVSFRRINTSILNRAGGTWFDIPDEKAIMDVDIDKRIQSTIKRKIWKKWGFKDPRASLTIKKYFPFLEDDVYLICCFRKPKKLVKQWKRKGVTTCTKDKIDTFNKRLISAIREFCEL